MVNIQYAILFYDTKGFLGKLICSIYDYMKQHSVKLNAILNMIKQICTVIFPLITVPYATRVLSTDSYGLVSYAFSIVSYFSLVAA